MLPKSCALLCRGEENSSVKEMNVYLQPYYNYYYYYQSTIYYDSLLLPQETRLLTSVCVCKVKEAGNFLFPSVAARRWMRAKKTSTNNSNTNVSDGCLHHHHFITVLYYMESKNCCFLTSICSAAVKSNHQNHLNV